jgi:P4 family phage/plasmid primase-like protien
MNSYIYLIQDGEFINTDVYKVGRTSQKGDTRRLNRFSSYNKDTIQKYLREVNNENVVDIETDIKKVFKLKYKLIKGTEWFDGNYKQMILDIDIIIHKYNEINSIEKDIKDETESISFVKDEPEIVSFVKDEPEIVSVIKDETESIFVVKDEPEIVSVIKDETESIFVVKDESESIFVVKDETESISVVKDETESISVVKDEIESISVVKDEIESISVVKDEIEYISIVKDETENLILNNLLNKSINQSHNDVALYIFEKYKNEFKCSSITQVRWYHYNNHKWNLSEKGIDFKKKISGEIAEDYSVYSKLCFNKYDEFKEECYEKDRWRLLFSKTIELISKLKTRGYKNAIFLECQELFYDKKFEENLDSNNNLLHFLNGIYDLDKKEFRQGYQEDNITLSTGINYIKNLNYKDYEKINQIEELINKIFPVEEVRNYVLNLLASFLHGDNKEQKFHIWNGCGSNGKSMLIDFYKKIMGEYCGSMSITYLTQYRSVSEQASPILAETRGKRFISLDEADSNDQINVGFIKQITGGDEITARKLNSVPITFKPKFKLVLTCNELPRIPSDDDGTWRRIRVVEFVSKFCDNPDPNKPYEFLIDRTLTNKLEQLKEVFMYMLIQIYQNSYIINGIIEPKEVTKNTFEYKKNNDIYLEFIEESIIEESTSSFGIDDIFPKFKMFLQENNFDTRKYNRRELEKRLNKFIGQCNMKKKWKGWKLTFNEDVKTENENKNE